MTFFYEEKSISDKMHGLSDEMHIRTKSGKFLQEFIYADGKGTNSFLVEQIRQ